MYATVVKLEKNNLLENDYLQIYLISYVKNFIKNFYYKKGI